MGKAENIVRTDGKTRNEVMTPSAILEPVMRLLGPIGLDPCSNPNSIVVSNTAVMLPEYAPAVAQFAQRTVYADGLQIVWRGHGLVFVNPPYSDPLMEYFLAKAIREFLGTGEEIVFLVPHRTANRYWPKTAGLFDLKIELYDRVQHHGEKHRSPFHQVLLYAGPRLERALGLAILGNAVVHPRHLRLK
jgi:hypothetical protein